MKIPRNRLIKISKKILIAGTFDILHPGHIFFIEEAAKRGEVYVIVSTDKNAERFKGEKPIVPEEQRLEVVQHIKKVREAKLGRADNDTLKTVQEIDPDIVLLGPDQKYDLETLQKGLREKGLDHIKVKRLEKYYDRYKLHSSSLIKKKIIEQYNKKKSN
ncbi:MAG: adenylyltransferase/cytidyltransferase family protein [Candidatus Lokiarchaeota archaeon]|nr:adenylyltransferase/cytidyltransferase family protein [Candidatus Lokiarchaeota archaeon]